MILQSLVEYYDRKTLDPESALAPSGFENKEIPFLITLDEKGNFLQINDTRTGEGKKKRSKSYIVPQGVKKTSGIAANLLWDTVEYVLGVDTKGKPERVAEQHAAFIKRLDELPQNDEGISAIRTFLKNKPMEIIQNSPYWKEFIETNPIISFQLAEDNNVPIFNRHAILTALQQSEKPKDAHTGICLVTGEPSTVERLHPAIKGVWGAQTAGANIISFNLRAFESYGKEQKQGENAPVGSHAVFAYTTALNHLLGKDSKQRIQVGDASTVFWADKPCTLEEDFSAFFSEPAKDADDPDHNVKAVEALYRSVEKGSANVSQTEETQFFVLGLAPNAARISIRFWLHGTVREFSERIVQHFNDLKIDHAEFEKPYLPLFRLLLSTATQNKADNIPPNLGGEVIRSILSGLPYPETLFQAAIRRIRSEHNVTYPRAAIIKACINRKARYHEEKLNVSLDTSNVNPGYLLGRLFAVLEKTQEEANPSLNATIRDRFYGAASSTPVTVFSNLLKLSKHHLAKIDNKGRQVNLDKLIGEIMDGLKDFPRLLPIEEQGRFAIGYYHQKQAFYKKSTSEQGE